VPRRATELLSCVVERDLDVRDVLIAPRRILAKAAGDDFHDVGGNRWRELVDRLRIVAEDLCRGRAPGIARERPLTGEHLVQHRAKAEDVGACIGLSPFQLFGGHVGERTDQHPGTRQ
jgi:hypothetical protein